jgi:UDP-N-acetylmuramoyl-tripeptide--D-alanyl-D-alanine ligase
LALIILVTSQASGVISSPDLAVVTAVTPEHMEFFGTIEAVAKEELSVSDFAAYTLINRDDVDGRFADFETNPNFSTYGTTGAAEYRFETADFSRETGYTGNVIAPEFPSAIPVSLKVLGEHSIRSVVAGVAVAARLGLTPQEIQNGAAKVQAVPGRMNMLAGIGDVIVIDDSYNSSPAAAEAALRTLYSFDEATQRIAVLGDMRELGETSRQEHEMLASVCDPNLLAWIVTVGPDMESFFTPVAKQRGCQVKNCRNAIEAAQFVRSVVEPGAVVLVKGSQNTIYLEEAVKLLIDNSEDVKLVRQSEGWKKTKDKYFSQFY